MNVVLSLLIAACSANPGQVQNKTQNPARAMPPARLSFVHFASKPTAIGVPGSSLELPITFVLEQPESLYYDEPPEWADAEPSDIFEAAGTQAISVKTFEVQYDKKKKTQASLSIIKGKDDSNPEDIYLLISYLNINKVVESELIPFHDAVNLSTDLNSDKYMKSKEYVRKYKNYSFRIPIVAFTGGLDFSIGMMKSYIMHRRPPVRYGHHQSVATSVHLMPQRFTATNPLDILNPSETARKAAAAEAARKVAESATSGTERGGDPTLHVGPRGGVYHYSASGKKVYQKKK